MATGQSQVVATYTGPAKRDLSAYQYHPMTKDTDGNIDYADTSAGTIVIGILQNKPEAAGEEAEVAIIGTSLLHVDATTDINEGDRIGSEAASYDGVKVTADKALYFAIALEPATSDGDYIEVLLVGGTHTISTT